MAARPPPEYAIVTPIDAPTDPYLDYRRPFIKDDDRRYGLPGLLLFICCLLVCPLIWVCVAGSVSHTNEPPTMPPTVPPPTMMPPTVPPTPAPPGACCCSGCATNRCIEDVQNQSECDQLCNTGLVGFIGGSGGVANVPQSCAAVWSSGQTCAQSGCGQPLDCCPEDPFVLEGSMYASAEPTLCGTHDYNCDERDDQYPCCYADAPIENGQDSRVIYTVGACQASQGQPLSQNPTQVCGACAGQSVVPGWECQSGLASSRKRFVPPCPSQCEQAQPVTPETPPQTGECALFVDRCIGSVGGDGETCCQVVVQ